MCHKSLHSKRTGNRRDVRHRGENKVARELALGGHATAELLRERCQVRERCGHRCEVLRKDAVRVEHISVNVE